MSATAVNWTRRLFRSARARVKSRVSFGDDENRPVEVYRAANESEAALVVALLDSEGIPAITRGESVGSVYGMQFGPLAEVSVLVKKILAPRAAQIIEERHLGMADADLVEDWWKDEDWPEDEEDSGS
jgi:hypothetical protein